MFEQDRVIGRLQRYVSTVPQIKSCFLSGSFGRRAPDTFSDIDVVFVFGSDEERAAAWARREEMARSVMPYVSLKAYVAAERRPFLYVVLLANGSLLELRFETQGGLLPNPFDSQIRILKDDNGWAAQFAARSAGLGQPQPTLTSEELETIDERFWIMFWDVLRLVARGDTSKPFPGYLELLHTTLPPMLHALPAAEPVRPCLIEVAYSGDAAATAAGLRVLLACYLQARDSLARHYHLGPVGDATFEREIKRLVERMV